MHHQRRSRHGSTGSAAPMRLVGASAAVKLAKFSEPAADGSGCILWTGAKDSGGYGVMRLKGRLVSAHRAAYEVHHNPIPEGMQVDHIDCPDVACVNPDHLQVVTPAQNIQLRDFRRGRFRSKGHMVAAFLRLVGIEGLRVFPTDRFGQDHRTASALTDRGQDRTESV